MAGLVPAIYALILRVIHNGDARHKGERKRRRSSNGCGRA